MNEEIIISKVREILGIQGISPLNMEYHHGPVVSTVIAYLDSKPLKSETGELTESISASLGQAGVRVTVKGLSLVIEVPNGKAERNYPQFRDAVSSYDYAAGKSLPLFLGYDSQGSPVTLDLATCPHILIAGAVHQGQGVLQKTIVNSLLRAKKPGEIKFLLADSKMVEMTDYRGLDESWFYGDGLIYTPNEVISHLNWLWKEMNSRYKSLYDSGCCSIDEFKKKHSVMPYIVVIINDYADYMGWKDDERNEFLFPLIRLVQKGRAVGIHCIISTQRPSVDYVKAIMKVNFPVRIATRCPDKVTSRLVIDSEGAENLIGRGDMILADGHELIRFQGLDTDENDVADTIAAANSYVSDVKPLSEKKIELKPITMGEIEYEARTAAELIIKSGVASTSMLQRELAWGFAKASRIMNQLERAGVVGPLTEGRREILVKDMDELNLAWNDLIWK